MRLVFAGTPEFAVATLKALYESQHEIVAVYTQPDRPSGRGQKLRPSAVKQAALALNLRLIQVEDFKSEEAIEELRSLGAEAMIVVAYGLL
ncbi:MAG: methionyl-tRNA formyltransferase, partial [Betaproteobacteria bacterium]